jgi:hypothetical protein
MNMKILMKCLLIAGVLVTSSTVLADEEDMHREANARIGAQVWLNNCARCHNLRRTDEFNDQQWITIVTHMRIRAGLTGQEARDLLHYLQASNDRP